MKYNKKDFINTYIIKVKIDGNEEELKNFGESELEVLDNMVDISIVDEVTEIRELNTGRVWQGSGSLKGLRMIKSKLNKIKGNFSDI
tara:strand:+ start:225 stop:485 length:261 start_codon:yes stop_codon:yes gene_type:complete